MSIITFFWIWFGAGLLSVYWALKHNKKDIFEDIGLCVFLMLSGVISLVFTLCYWCKENKNKVIYKRKK